MRMFKRSLRRTLVEGRRVSALAAGNLEERIKWGHLVYFSDGPVLLIRAEEQASALGFWRGKRLRNLDERLKPGGKYEMATITFKERDKISGTQAKGLVNAAICPESQTR